MTGAKVARLEKVREVPHSRMAEEAVLGGIFLDPEVVGVVRNTVKADDFYLPSHRVICVAIFQLHKTGGSCDVVSVSEYLKSTGELEGVGGLSYLGTLGRETTGVANIEAHAQIVAERAQQRRLLTLGPDIERDIAGGATAEQVLKNVAAVLRRLEPSGKERIELRHAAEIVNERRESDWFTGLEKVLERKVLAVIAGTRGTFKSAIALHWAMIAALNGYAVVLLSAEGAGLDRRIDAWMRHYAPAVDLRGLIVLALERALNLVTCIADLAAAIEAADVKPALIVVDTFSKYAPGLDENDNAAVAAFLATLTSGLRERFGCTVLLVAHAGHGDSKRPRGASTLMANPDSEYIVQRPDITGMTVTVSRERFKDAPSLAPLTYIAESVDLGRTDRFGDPVTSIVMMRASDDSAVTRPTISGKNQKRLLVELERLSADPTCIGIWTESELRTIARETLQMRKESARDAVVGLRQLGYITATIGGSRLTHGSGAKGANRGEKGESPQEVGGERGEGSTDPAFSPLPSPLNREVGND